MKILITGCSGALGLVIASDLHKRGHELTDYSLEAPASAEVRSIKGDITDAEGRGACRGQEAIIHLAGIPGPGRLCPNGLRMSTWWGRSTCWKRRSRQMSPKLFSPPQWRPWFRVPEASIPAGVPAH